jgi:hypothetical protein
MEIIRPLLVLSACFGLVLVTVFLAGHAYQGGLRLAFLQAAVLLGVMAWLITEILSAIRAITFPAVALAWAAVGVAATASAVVISKRRGARPSPLGPIRLREAACALPGSMRAAFAFIILSAGVLGFIAFAAAPNTWDSLTYHLSRILHWEQNRSLAFYPTAIQRQLAFNPLAEIAVLNLQLLAGSDRLANFVQWFAMIGCVVGGSIVAGLLGGDRRAQVVAALTTATLPMGILQSTSTQNDYVVSLWCVAFVVFTTRPRAAQKPWQQSAFAGAALGLAVLTKATALLFLAPFGIWFAVSSIKNRGRIALGQLAVLLLLSLLLLAPHSSRNYGLYGNLMGTTRGREPGQYTNQPPGLASLISNALRNTSLQLAVPSENVNDAIQRVVQSAHTFLGLDINDPQHSWEGAEFRVVFSTYEDSASDPIHMLLILAGCVLGIKARKGTRTIYALCSFAGFLLFCFILRWQPWNNRLTLPLLVLGLPLVAVVLSERLQGKGVLILAIALAVAATPYVVANPTRPVIGQSSILAVARIRQYFANVPDDYAAYDEAARMIHNSGCTRIGLASSPQGREYLLWITNRVYEPRIRIEHILVRNPSRRFAGAFVPCALVANYPVEDSILLYQDVLYRRILGTDRLTLFLPPAAPP